MSYVRSLLLLMACSQRGSPSSPSKGCDEIVEFEEATGFKQGWVRLADDQRNDSGGMDRLACEAGCHNGAIETSPRPSEDRAIHVEQVGFS
jgi:hypothetical protein